MKHDSSSDEASHALELNESFIIIISVAVLALNTGT